MIKFATSLATFDRALYSPIHMGIVAKVGKHPDDENVQEITSNAMITVNNHNAWNTKAILLQGHTKWCIMTL